MSRRGSVRKEANGTWTLVADVPGGDRRRQLRRRGFGTRREAQTALTELLAAVQGGTFVKPDRLKLGEYLERWADGLPSTGLSAPTVSSYRHNLRLHVLPVLSQVPLQELTPVDLDHLYAELLTHGKRNGGGLSRRTVRYIHTIVSAALSDGVVKGLLQRNPALASSPPSAKSAAAPEMGWWKPAELRVFLSSLEGHELAPLLRVAAMTGMRRGEVIGLRWRDVDLDSGRVSVRRQVTSTDYRVRSDQPKTERARRTVDLDPETLDILRRHRVTQAAGSQECRGEVAGADALVFPSVGGSLRHPQSVSAAFDRLVRRSRLPRIRFHDLRHTHAAHLIAAGIDPLAISRRLGHASVAFTLDRYGHLFDHAGAVAASKVADLVDQADQHAAD